MDASRQTFPAWMRPRSVTRTFLPAVNLGFGIEHLRSTNRVSRNNQCVTYSLSESGTGNPLNPQLVGSTTGSLLPFGSVTWCDMIFPDLSTGFGDGTFKMTFTDGDTLFGTLHVQGDFSSFQSYLSHSS